MDMEAARTAMVDTQVRPNDVTDRNLIAAMMLTPREKFLPKELEAIAYAEKPLETSPGRWMWAARDLGKLIEETEVEKGERVLVVAAGSGYAAAVLAAMGASVVALEDDEERVAQLSAQFADASDVTVAKGDLKTLSGVDGLLRASRHGFSDRSSALVSEVGQRVREDERSHGDTVVVTARGHLVHGEVKGFHLEVPGGQTPL